MIRMTLGLMARMGRMSTQTIIFSFAPDDLLVLRVVFMVRAATWAHPPGAAHKSMTTCICVLKGCV